MMDKNRSMVPVRSVIFCVFFFFFCSVGSLASAQSTAKQFSLIHFNDSLISCTGHSGLTPQNHTLPGAICLTPPDTSMPEISGRCSYSNYIEWSEDFSFSTMFSFTTLRLMQYQEGEGFTFFIGPDGEESNSSTGGYLGLLNDSIEGKPSNGYFAVEFDLVNQTKFNDPPYKHVGINLNSMSSIQTAQPKFEITSYSSIEKVYAWIEYDGRSNRVDVRLNTEPKKPCNSLLSTTLDKSMRHVLGHSRSIVGFSSSTGGNLSDWRSPNSQTTIWDWAFSAEQPVTNIYHGNEKCHIRITKWTLAVIVICALCLASLLMLGSLFVLYRRAKKVPALKEENKALLREKDRLVSKIRQLDFGAREFQFQELKEATEGFQHQIGRGGFGTVYKGELTSGTIAVKSIKKTGNTEDAKQLVAEVQVIGRVRHRNIVPLLGWCYDQGHMLLVYRFMNNADLDSHLFPKPGADPLSWNKRVTVLRGVAAALVFLHEEFESDEQVVHRDVKPNNVMLDDEFNAKLGDFGLARLFNRSSAGQHGDVVAGTPGYLAPEYWWEATSKTDVYSYGVLALVVATGRRPVDDKIPGRDLVKWVRGLYDEDRLIEAGDPAITAKFDLNQRRQMETVLQVGLRCCLFEASDRPSMLDVQHSLPGLSAILTMSLPRQFPPPLRHNIDIDTDDSLVVGESSHSSEFVRSDTDDRLTQPFSTIVDVR